MKRYIYNLIAVAILTFSFLAVSAQVDRSKPPKPLPARPINFGKVENFKLPNGLTVIVVENHKLPKVRVNLNLDIYGVKEGNKAGYSSMFGDMLRAGTKMYTKDQLDQKIDLLGIDLFASSTNIGFSGLKKQLSPSLEIMKEVLFNATFSNTEELNKLKKQAKTGLEASEKNPDAIAGRVRQVLLYGKEDAWGEYETPQTIDNITLDDFKNHYQIYFKPNIAYLSFIGDITLAEAKALATKYFGTWKKGTVSVQPPALKKNAAGMKIAFVDLPTASQSVINIIGLTDLKKTSSDYFPSVLGNNILGVGSFGRLFKNIRETHGWTYGAYSSLSDNAKRLGSFSASAKVRNNVTDSAVIEFIKEIKRITSEAPTEEEIASKKAEYSGNFSMSLERPETVGNFVYNQLTQNLTADFYKNYLKNINDVTGTQITTSLNNVIDPKNLTILIVGKGEEVLPGLEKLGYPIQYFDKFGNPTQKPEGKKAVSNDVTAAQVLTKYINAIAGSRENAEKVKTVITDAEIEVPQAPMPLPITIKQAVPNKTVQIISVMGQTMKQGFDGEKAYGIMGRPVTEEQMKKYKETKGIFSELYDDKEAVLDGIVAINGKDAYKVKVNKEVSYYDVQTGLKVKEEDGNTVVEFFDYKDFGGYKFPTKMTMGQEGGSSKLTVKNMIINPAIPDSEFKQ